MSTLTLPHVAALVHDEGPFYAASWTTQPAPDETNVIWLVKPILPDGEQLRWATDADVPSPHLVLDAVAVAELLFCSVLDAAGPLLPADILRAMDVQLARCRCDLGPCAARLAGEYGDHPAAARDRMVWCLALAAQVLGTGTEATA
jgi:hypothetical protein